MGWVGFLLLGVVLMADGLLPEETEEGQQFARDYLGRLVPVAFKGQPALPVGGAPAAITAGTGPVGPGGAGLGAAGGDGAGAPARAVSDGGPSALALTQLGLKASDVAAKLVPAAPSAGPITVPTSALLGDAVPGPPAYRGARATAPAPGVEGEFLGAGLDSGGLSASDIALATQAEQGLTGAEGGVGAGSVGAGLGVITGLASKAGAKPPVTEEQAYLNMALDLLGGLSAPVTLGMGPAVASALEFAMADWFRPSIPHQVREDLDTMRGQSILSNYFVPNILTARTLPELAQALSGGREYAGYPVPATGGGEDVLAALEAGTPFAWQQGIAGERLEAINAALNPLIAQQAQLIRASEAGDMEARQTLADLRRRGGYTLLSNEMGGYGAWLSPSERPVDEFTPPGSWIVSPEDVARTQAMLRERGATYGLTPEDYATLGLGGAGGAQEAPGEALGGTGPSAPSEASEIATAALAAPPGAGISGGLTPGTLPGGGASAGREELGL